MNNLHIIFFLGICIAFSACSDELDSDGDSTVPDKKTTNTAGPLWDPPMLDAQQLSPYEGIWVAQQGELGTISAFLTEKRMLLSDETSNNANWDALGTDIEALLRQDQRNKTNCIWLELNKDGSGYRHECALNNGTPTPLEKIDPTTGERESIGFPFEWYVDADTLKLRTSEPFHVRMIRDSVIENQKAELWHLRLVQHNGTSYKVEEYLPELDYVLPVQQDYVRHMK